MQRMKWFVCVFLTLLFMSGCNNSMKIEEAFRLLDVVKGDETTQIMKVSAWTSGMSKEDDIKYIKAYFTNATFIGYIGSSNYVIVTNIVDHSEED